MRAGSRTGFGSNFGTVRAGRLGSCNPSAVGRPVVRSLLPLAVVGEARRGERELTVAELRELVDELTRQEWRILDGTTMRRMCWERSPGR